MLISNLIFVGQELFSLVSVLSGSWEGVWTVCCLIGKSYGILLGIATRGCWVNISGYLERTLKNGGGAGSKRGSKTGYSNRICLASQGMGTEGEERPPKVVCNRAGGELEELDLGKRYISYLLLWPACFSGRLGWWVPREYSLELELGTGIPG